MTTPSYVWDIPEAPGPEVRTLADKHGRKWKRGDGDTWLMPDSHLIGWPEYVSWPNLFRHYAPLTDATEREHTEPCMYVNCPGHPCNCDREG